MRAGFVLGILFLVAASVAISQIAQATAVRAIADRAALLGAAQSAAAAGLATALRTEATSNPHAPFVAGYTAYPSPPPGTTSFCTSYLTTLRCFNAAASYTPAGSTSLGGSQGNVAAANVDTVAGEARAVYDATIFVEPQGCATNACAVASTTAEITVRTFGTAPYVGVESVSSHDLSQTSTYSDAPAGQEVGGCTTVGTTTYGCLSGASDKSVEADGVCLPSQDPFDQTCPAVGPTASGSPAPLATPIPTPNPAATTLYTVSSPPPP